MKKIVFNIFGHGYLGSLSSLGILFFVNVFINSYDISENLGNSLLIILFLIMTLFIYTFLVSESIEKFHWSLKKKALLYVVIPIALILTALFISLVLNTVLTSVIPFVTEQK